jgi:clan AA aspartic protease
MIVGKFEYDLREVVVRLLVKGGEGRAIEVDFVLDTGFTEELALSQDLMDALLLPYAYSDEVALAAGRVVEVSVHNGIIVWEGSEKNVLIQSTEGQPLLGVSLLLEHRVNLTFTENGIVTIEIANETGAVS